MSADAIMRIQSMTKAVTTVAALRLVEANRLALDDSLEDWLPELADRLVLRLPDAALDDTVPADRPITLRHLITNTCGYGMHLAATPMAAAMTANATAVGPEPFGIGADEWLGRLSQLPLSFQPGEGWRYHHGFSILGILLSRVTGRPLQDHLRDDLFAPLGMVDSGLGAPPDQAGRLPAAYRYEGGALVETAPAGGGFYAGPPPYDMNHGELVSTAADYHRFARMLAGGGQAGGGRVISNDHLAAMSTDQVPDRAKSQDSFFAGFWDATGWGFGVGVTTGGPHAGRFGWAGGQGTSFFVDPDGTVGMLLTQVELGEEMTRVMQEFDDVR